MKDRKVRLGVVGTGIWGRMHIRAYVQHASAELVAVCDLDEQRAKEVADEFNIPNHYTDVDDMLEAGLDGISVATPDAAHADITIKVATKGVHVLVEKPLATTIEECERMISAAASNNVYLMVDWHIHSIELHTPPDQRDRILREGIDRIAEFSGTKPYQFRAGMFYLDRDMVERLDGLGFTMDSSLAPGRYRPQCEVKETRCFSFNMPMDYRGFPAHPYRLTQNIVEVPLSPYCQDWLNPQSMWQTCLNESTGLSILYNHAKNTGDGDLMESFDGRFRVGMSEVISKLMDEGFQYVSFDKLTDEIEDQTCSGVLERLPRGAASIA